MTAYDRDKDAVYINGDNNSQELLKAMRDKKYRRIYLSPEMLQVDEIRKILKSDK
jgi:superfamily II DNA helicase RecQ